MLECYGMDILPFDGTDGTNSKVQEGDDAYNRSSLLSIGEEVGWCLFSIDVRNTYGLPFEVTFECEQEGTLS